MWKWNITSLERFSLYLLINKSIIYLAKIYFIDLDNNIQEIQLFKYWREEKGKSESNLESLWVEGQKARVYISF